MAKVTVYRWCSYDITSDNKPISRRWATEEAVKGLGLCGAAVIKDTAIEVDDSVLGLDDEFPGMTLIGFDATPREAC